MKTLVIGAAILDIIMKIPSLPQKGEDILCKERVLSVGGCAYNVGNILRSFEIDHDLFVPIGNGVYSDVIKKSLKEDNYSILINDLEMDNGYCLCLVEDDGERTFITEQGIESQYKRQWFNNVDAEEYDNIYIAGYQACGNSGRVISQWLLEQKGKNIFFAPGPVINKIEKNTMNKILSLNPILHLNKKEALDFTGEPNVKDSILALHKLNRNIVFVTMGGDGVMFYDGNEMIKIQGEKVDVADTIGAGDAHIATIIAGYSKGYDFKYGCKLANKVAAQIVQVQGSKIPKEFCNKLLKHL